MATGTIKSSSYKLIGTGNGNSAITIPSGISELLCAIRVNNTTAYCSINIPRALLDNTVKSFRTGYYYKSTGYADCEVNATATSVTLAYANSGGTDYTSTSTLYVYGK
jgi:hypothetical protein